MKFRRRNRSNSGITPPRQLHKTRNKTGKETEKKGRRIDIEKDENKRNREGRIRGEGELKMRDKMAGKVIEGGREKKGVV